MSPFDTNFIHSTDEMSGFSKSVILH